MRVLIEAHHPSDIHFFKYAVRELRDRGTEVLMLGRDRDVMRQLLDAYSWIPSKIASTEGRDNRFPLAEMLKRQASVAAAIVSFRPDLVLSLMGSYTQSARLLGVPSYVFTDSEHQSFNHRIAHPFATRIYTPECFTKDLGRKQRRYAGYHELAYLHPDRFEPREEVLEHMPGATRGGYAIVRLSAWNTLHDVGKSGFGSALDRVMGRLTKELPVFAVPEGGELDPRWESHRLRVPPHRFHDSLAFAKVVLSEGASTASEAACLGVPTVYLNPLRLGYLEEQERRYGLVYNADDADDALARALEWIDSRTAEQNGEARRRLVSDHVDVTRFVVDEVDDLLSQSAVTSHSSGSTVTK